MVSTRLIYYSENQIDRTRGSVVKTLSAILKSSNKNNQALDLTGALIFDDQWFVQVLEGERSKVWQTFERIRDDERHANVVIAELTGASERMFGNWWMGLAARNARTEHVFAPFLCNQKFDPRQMTGDRMLELMLAVAQLGLRRGVTHPGVQVART